MNDLLIDIETKTKQYFVEWQTFVNQTGLEDELKPMAIGWKVTDRSSFDAAHIIIMSHSEQCHIGTIDDRLIGSYVLQQSLAGVSIIKLMQLRPGSEDPVGLDHMDFYHPNPKSFTDKFTEVGAEVVQESNNVHAWLSVHFGPAKREAKLVDHTVLQAGIIELQQTQRHLVGILN